MSLNAFDNSNSFCSEFRPTGMHKAKLNAAKK